MHGFSESIKRKVEGGMKGHNLVNEVLRELESIVLLNRAAKREVGDKMIVCGGVARWWDKEKISLRREVYIRRLIRVGKICWMSTVDYVEK